MNRGQISTLLELGFGEKEAKIYMALLSLGKGTVSEITRKAGLNRTTGYDLLNTLVQKGLASVTGKEPKQEYLAESPDKILDQKNEELRAAKSLVPQLKSIHTVAGRPKVRFYEGKQGLIDVYEDTLTSSETIRAYATVDDMHRALPGYFPKYYKRRADKGIHIRAIIPATPIGKDRATKDKSEARDSALVPADEYYFSPEINIYDNKVMIASWREQLGIIIESAEIADAMKKIYELAWLEAKRLQA